MAAPLDDAARQSERVQRDLQLQMQQDRDNAERARNVTPKIEIPEPATPKGTGSGCVIIHEVVFSTTEHMSESEAQDMVQPYVEHCLGVNDIEKLLSDVTRFYIERGFSTTRVYLPEQDMSKGKLYIKIVEGRVQSLKLQDGGENNSVDVVGAFPLVEGEVFNLRDFEQGLEQVNHLGSNHATMDIMPGDTAGQSVIVIKNQPTAPWHASLSGDNYGSKGTGRYQSALTLGYDDALGINDFFNYTRRQSIPLNEHNRNSTSNNISVWVPIGYVTLSAGYSDSKYQTETITAGGSVLELRGDSRNIFFRGDYMAWRDQDDKVSLSATLTQKQSNNFAAGQKLDVSSRILTVADYAVDYATSLGGGALDTSFGLSQGLHFWNSMEDRAGLPTDAPRAQFYKLVANASYGLPFEMMDEKFSWSTQFNGQYALNALYGSEQISLGGPYTVRGFYNSNIANDDGFYVRNDFSILQNLGSVYGTDIMLKPYIGLDGGYVKGSDGSVHGGMVGAAVGSTLFAGPLMIDAFVAHAVVRPGTQYEGVTGFVRASASF